MSATTTRALSSHQRWPVIELVRGRFFGPTQPAFLSQPALMSRTLRPPNGRKKSPTKQDPVGQVLLSKIQSSMAAVQPSSWLGCAHTALHVHITANLTSCKVMLCPTSLVKDNYYMRHHQEDASSPSPHKVSVTMLPSRIASTRHITASFDERGDGCCDDLGAHIISLFPYLIRTH